MIHHLYDLSLLSQKELEPANFPHFINRANHVLEKMTAFLTP